MWLQSATVVWEAVPVTLTAPTDAAERLPAEQRREALLDVAKELVNEAGPDAVTMGTVAERAELTRALVYKHFENRHDILSALYRREAAALDAHIRDGVMAAPDGFEPKLRAFVGACLDAVSEHGRFFSPLRSAGGPSARDQQRRWNRRTGAYFVGLAATEFGLDQATAGSAMGVLFGGIQALLSQMRRSPSEERRRFLEDTYVTMTIGALRQLSSAATEMAHEKAR